LLNAEARAPEGETAREQGTTNGGVAHLGGGVKNCGYPHATVEHSESGVVTG